MRATLVHGEGDIRIETVPNVVALHATGKEITPGGATAFIEAAAKYLIYGKKESL